MGVLWFVGRRSLTLQSVRETEQNPKRIYPVARAASSMIEILEGRVLLSAAPLSPQIAPAISAGPPTFAPFVSVVVAQGSNPAGDLVIPGQNTKTFDITYSSPNGIDQTTIGTGNITVSGPFGNLVVSGFTIINPTAVTGVIVQYTLMKADSSNFTPNDNGTYLVNTTATVADLASNVEDARAPIDFFLVNIPDTTAPVATEFHSTDIDLAGGGTHQFTITYADDVAIDATSISTSNVTVTGPNGQNVPVISAVVDQNFNGTPRTVTYTCQDPSGLWSATDNGTYFISINSTLTDTSGNPIVPVIGVGSFAVNIEDVSSPTTVTFNPPDVSTGDPSETFTVTYSDNVSIQLATLNSSNIAIIGPHGQAEFATFVSASTTTDGSPITATYSFTAPDTTDFTSADNGVYTFNLLSTVVDTAGHNIPSQTLGAVTLALNPADIARTDIGQFGLVNGKNVVLHFRDVPNGTVGTFRLSGGVGQAFLETANSLIDLYIADSGGGVKLTINSNASHPLQIGNVLISGTLLKGAARTSELRGTFFASGAIQQLSVANIFGSVVANGPIGAVSVVHGITGGEILSGVNLGSDGQFGGTGAAADSYAAGSIASVKVGGSIASTFIGAGINPGVDGQFNSSDDTLIGGNSSLIGFLQAKSADTTSKFEAGSFGSAKFGKKFVDLSTDARFIVPPAAT